MSAQTKIEWCDSTFNPWIGCTRVSPACDDCYAARSTPARTGGVKWGAGEARRRTAAANWKLPERWNREQFVQCVKCGWRGYKKGGPACPECCSGEEIPARRRVFCASLADWLDNEVPIEWLVDLLDLIRRTPNLDWLLLTKRIGNWKKRIQDATSACWESNPALRDWLLDWVGERSTPANVWIGSTTESQKRADEDVRKLLRVPAIVRFLSIEPMLGSVNLCSCDGAAYRAQGHPFLIDISCPLHGKHRVHWVIAGGESGPKARPSHPDWYRALRDQCAAAGVPFLFKQWGEWSPHAPPGCKTEPGPSAPDGWKHFWRVGKANAGRLLDGREHSEFPAVTA
ncbi:MAG: phage Gp37/Gp68 family protein [Solimonas sp.]